MTRTRGNLFGPTPRHVRGESFERLAGNDTTRIERIVSRGHASPPDFWYDQDQDEWVVLLSGEARLRFEDESVETTLRPGDYILIPAHTRHRVEWTDPDSDTVWLAVFLTRDKEATE